MPSEGICPKTKKEIVIWIRGDGTRTQQAEFEIIADGINGHVTQWQPLRYPSKFIHSGQGL